MVPVEQSPEQPLYWDSNRAKFNITLIFALAVVVIGVGFGGGILLIIVGLAVGAYSWLTTPKQYLIYTNALVIAYGRPRTRVFPFEHISHVETLSLPVGTRLRVRLVSGGRVMITSVNPEEFRDHLDDAMDKYQGSGRRDELSGDESDSPTPY